MVTPSMGRRRAFVTYAALHGYAEARGRCRFRVSSRGPGADLWAKLALGICFLAFGSAFIAIQRWMMMDRGPIGRHGIIGAVMVLVAWGAVVLLARGLAVAPEALAPFTFMSDREMAALERRRGARAERRARAKAHRRRRDLEHLSRFTSVDVD